MAQGEFVIAVFSNSQEAEVAVRDLTSAGIEIENLSVVGKRYHSAETVVGFYNAGDRIKFWGKRGAFWGGLWVMFVGGISLTVLGVGDIMVLGYLAPFVGSAVDGAIIVGGLSALGAALYSAGIPKGSALQYEQAVKADGFLVIVHGAIEVLTRARALLTLGGPSRLDLHEGLSALCGPIPAPERAASIPSRHQPNGCMHCNGAGKDGMP